MRGVLVFELGSDRQVEIKADLFCVCTGFGESIDEICHEFVAVFLLTDGVVKGDTGGDLAHLWAVSTCQEAAKVCVPFLPLRRRFLV